MRYWISIGCLADDYASCPAAPQLRLTAFHFLHGPALLCFHVYQLQPVSVQVLGKSKRQVGVVEVKLPR